MEATEGGRPLLFTPLTSERRTSTATNNRSHRLGTLYKFRADRDVTNSESFNCNLHIKRRSKLNNYTQYTQ